MSAIPRLLHRIPSATALLFGLLLAVASPAVASLARATAGRKAAPRLDVRSHAAAAEGSEASAAVSLRTPRRFIPCTLHLHSGRGLHRGAAVRRTDGAAHGSNCAAQRRRSELRLLDCGMIPMGEARSLRRDERKNRRA